MYVVLYVDETARNLYTHGRARQHQRRRVKILTKQIRDKHEDMGSVFKAEVDRTNTDCLTRQVKEGVFISNYGTKYNLLNIK